MMLLIYCVIEIIVVFIGVIFVTLLERKVLGLIQFRLGPNKVLFKGVIQSLSDAIKLMTKKSDYFFFVSILEHNIMPLGMLFLMMTMWMVIPSSMSSLSSNLLIILCLLSISVYPIMFGSWFSGSYYSMMGSIRSIAQVVSYEVSLILIVLGLVIFTGLFDLGSFFDFNMGVIYLLMVFMMLMLFSSILSELGRSPVDLLEGESELVSGFSTEYSSTKFALIFLAEYGLLMFMSGILSSVCMGFKFFSAFWSFMTIILVILLICIRGIMPRMRYDQLMMVCWLSMLSMSLSVLVFNLGYLVFWLI